MNLTLSMKPSDLLARLEERQIHMQETLTQILEQTSLTNGRVTKLEKWQSKLSGAWSTILIIAGASATICGVVIGVLEVVK